MASIFDLLPKETRWEIVSYLDWRSIMAIKSACTSLHRYLGDESLYQHLTKQRYRHLPIGNEWDYDIPSKKWDFDEDPAEELFPLKEKYIHRFYFRLFELNTILYCPHLASKSNLAVATQDEMVIAGTIVGYQLTHGYSKNTPFQVFQPGGHPVDPIALAEDIKARRGKNGAAFRLRNGLIGGLYQYTKDMGEVFLSQVEKIIKLDRGYLKIE